MFNPQSYVDIEKRIDFELLHFEKKMIIEYSDELKQNSNPLGIGTPQGPTKGRAALEIARTKMASSYKASMEEEKVREDSEGADMFWEDGLGGSESRSSFKSDRVLRFDENDEIV